MIAASAAAVHLFTGNNIGPRGDLASRSLKARLEVDRPDPENREFRHPDPIGWTEANRGKVLRALYTILLRSPALQPGSDVVPQTRFKGWWRLVGSAVENAAKEQVEAVAALAMDRSTRCPPIAVNFRDLFLSQEDGDEENASLADALRALHAKWPQGATFQASDVARLINDRSGYQIDADKERAAVGSSCFRRCRLIRMYPRCPAGKMIKRHAGEPVQADDCILILKSGEDGHSKSANFYVLAS
jgi:hypothetical protein